MSGRYVVQPAWRASYRDGTTAVRSGWQVIDQVEQEWVQTFATKREAKLAADSMNLDHIIDAGNTPNR